VVSTLVTSSHPFRCTLGLVFVVLLFAAGCKHGGGHLLSEYAYVAAPQVNVRDRLSTIYNKAAVVKNGERVEILEKSKHFVRIRTSGGQEGWVELRFLVDPAIHDGFDKLVQDNENVPVQALGATRFELNLHLTPGRETEHLYQLGGGEKVQILKRAIAEKNAAPKPQAKPIPKAPNPAANKPDAKAPGKAAIPQPQVTPVAAAPPAAFAKQPEKPPAPPVYEDWYLVRDSQKRVGWVLARMIDVDVPMEIAQYAEGQRIVASPILNQVMDAEQNRQVPQYLVLATENKDGLPFDFNQLRVFTWNVHRHRYETAYRERNLVGVFPVQVGHEVFDKEGDLPTFTVRVQDEATGQYVDKKYKMNGPIVRRALAPGEEPQKPVLTRAKEVGGAHPRKAKSGMVAGRRHHRR
jgi:SH3-like domain-containing protein